MAWGGADTAPATYFKIAAPVNESKETPRLRMYLLCSFALGVALLIEACHCMKITARCHCNRGNPFYGAFNDPLPPGATTLERAAWFFSRVSYSSALLLATYFALRAAEHPFPRRSLDSVNSFQRLFKATAPFCLSVDAIYIGAVSYTGGAEALATLSFSSAVVHGLDAVMCILHMPEVDEYDSTDAATIAIAIAGLYAAGWAWHGSTGRWPYNVFRLRSARGSAAFALCALVVAGAALTLDTARAWVARGDSG